MIYSIATSLLTKPVLLVLSIFFGFPIEKYFLRVECSLTGCETNARLRPSDLTNTTVHLFYFHNTSSNSFLLSMGSVKATQAERGTNRMIISRLASSKCTSVRLPYSFAKFIISRKSSLSFFLKYSNS